MNRRSAIKAFFAAIASVWSGLVWAGLVPTSTDKRPPRSISGQTRVAAGDDVLNLHACFASQAIFKEPHNRHNPTCLIDPSFIEHEFLFPLTVRFDDDGSLLLEAAQKRMEFDIERETWVRGVFVRVGDDRDVQEIATAIRKGMSLHDIGERINAKTAGHDDKWVRLTKVNAEMPLLRGDKLVLTVEHPFVRI